MKNGIKLETIVVAGLVCLLAGPAVVAQGSSDSGWIGLITPKVHLIDRSADDQSGFLERYHVREGVGGEDAYVDMDLNVAWRDGTRDVFTFEQIADGTYNRTSRLRFDADKLAFFGSFTNYRSATGTLGYRYSPGQAPGGTDPTYNTPPQTASGYFAQFNDDSGRSSYTVDRMTYGAGIRLKPSLFGDLASIDLSYEGYERDGNRFSPWIAGGSDFAGTLRQLQRWRGFDQPIDETMGAGAVNLTLSPGGSFHMAYDGWFESFDNNGPSYTMGDMAAFLPPGFVITGTNGTKPLQFVPDSSLTTHAFRLTKDASNWAVAAGYSMDKLEQDSFAQRQLAAGFEGETGIENAYLQFSTRLSDVATLRGSYKYYSRDNDSTFPAPGLISASQSARLGVRINNIESSWYGLSGVFRHAATRTTITTGWKREDTSRDLTFHDGPGITAQRSLYGGNSLSDELYVNVVSRPRKGLTLRLTTSYLWADETALVTEPEDAVVLRALVSYVTPGGALLSGYYNYRDQQNSEKSFTNAVSGTGADGAAVFQDVADTFNAAGLLFSMNPAPAVTLSLGLDWVQNDFETYYFSTNRRRFENPANGITFTVRDRSNYKVANTSLTLGGQWQMSDDTALSAGFTHTKSDGNIASGLIASELAATTIDGAIDNALNSLMLGMSHQWNEKFGFWADFSFDDYTDNAWSVISDELITVAVGFTIKL